MTEDDVRRIVRLEIAKALRDAEVDGPHMALIRRMEDQAVRISIAREASEVRVAEVRQTIRQGARPSGQRFTA